MGFWDTVGKVLDEGWEKSKIAANKAREYATIGALNAEILSLETKKTNIEGKLGSLVYKKSQQPGESSLSFTDADVADLIFQIHEIEKNMTATKERITTLQPSSESANQNPAETNTLKNDENEPEK